MINRQMLLSAKSDRDDALRRQAVGEDTPRLRDLLAGAIKRVAKIENEIAEQEAKAVADRKAAQEKAENSKNKKFVSAPQMDRAPLPEDIELPCVDCGSGFTFTGKDQFFFKKQGWTDPSRCADCRTSKKSAKPTGTDLSCCDCETTFFFSDGKARMFEEKGWEQPKRCYDCSISHKTMAPLLINCEGCSKEFSFSVKLQKEFKAKGWSAPKRCRDCIRAKHEKKEVASVKA